MPVAICVGVVVGDIVAKAWAQHALAEPLALTAWFYLKLYYNHGLFLGLLPVFEMGVLHWILFCSAALGIAWRMAIVRNAVVAAGYAMVLGGLAGNLIDRARGAVVDYLAFGPLVGDRWLCTNLADLAMVAGLTLMAVILIRNRFRRGRARRP